MKSAWKRMIALILAMAMSLSLIGANVWAAELQSMESSSESVCAQEGSDGEEESAGDDAVPAGDDSSEEVPDDKPSSVEETSVAEEGSSDNAETSSEDETIQEQELSEDEETAGEEASEEQQQESSEEDRTKAEREKPHFLRPEDTSKAVNSAHMWYCYNGNIDIRGYSNGNVIQTTYDDDGYSTVMSCDGDEETFEFEENNQTKEHSSGLTVSENVDFSQDGSYAIVTYTVRNNTNSTKHYSLGVHADVDIEDDDYATIYRTSKGLKMVNTETNITYYLICKEISGWPSANTLWIGYYDERADNVFNNGGPETLTGTDSAFAFSWKDRIITADSSTTYTYQIGIGESGAIKEYYETGKGFSLNKDINGFSHLRPHPILCKRQCPTV